MGGLSSGSVGDTRGPDFTRMAIRRMWRSAKQRKDGKGMLEALDQAAERGSSVSGSITQDDDQAMRSVQAQEVKNAGVVADVINKSPQRKILDEAKKRLQPPSDKQTVLLDSAPPPKPPTVSGGGDLGATGQPGAAGGAGGALAKSARDLFPDSQEIGMEEDVPFGFRETGVSRGRKLIAPVDEQGPAAPPSMTARTSGPAVAPLSERDPLTGKVTGLSEYGKQFLKDRYAKGVPLETQRELRDNKARLAADLETKKTRRAAFRAPEEALRRTVNAAAEKRRAQEMERNDRVTEAKTRRNEATVERLSRNQQAVVNRMREQADFEEENPIREPNQTRKILTDTARYYNGNPKYARRILQRKR